MHRVSHQSSIFRTLTTVLLFTICVAAIYGTSASAATQSTKRTPKKSSIPLESAQAVARFDTTRSSLPPNYEGNSFMTLYRRAVMVGPKGEFETTAEYEARSKKHVEGTYAIVLNVSDSSLYDADKEAISTSARMGAAFIGARSEGHFENYRACYLVDFVFRGESHHPASNAFGASTVVTSTTSDTRAILPVGPLSGAATFAFKLPRADAPRIKPRLKLKMLLVGSIAPLQEPPVGSGSGGENGFSFTTATISDPSESFTHYYLLRMNVSDLWVFDPETGTVLAKQSDPDVARGIDLRSLPLAGGPSGAEINDRTRELLYRTAILDLQNQKLVAQAAMDSNERALGVKK